MPLKDSIFKDVAGVERCFFKQGDHLIRIGQRIDYVYYLEKGIVNREIVNENGNRTFLAQKKGGCEVDSIVGLLLLYDAQGEDFSDNDFIAVTDCICYRIPADVCKAYFLSHPELLERVVQLAVAVSNEVRKNYLVKTEVPAYVQLCQLIWQNRVVEKDGVFLPKHFTNIEMAKHLATHRVTVSRMLRVLREENVIEKTPRGLKILNQEALAAYANGKKTLHYH